MYGNRYLRVTKNTSPCPYEINLNKSSAFSKWCFENCQNVCHIKSSLTRFHVFLILSMLLWPNFLSKIPSFSLIKSTRVTFCPYVSNGTVSADALLKFVIVSTCQHYRIKVFTLWWSSPGWEQTIKTRILKWYWSASNACSRLERLSVR